MKLDFFIFSGKEQSETLLTCRRVFLSDMSCIKYEVECLEMAGMSVVICVIPHTTQICSDQFLIQ